MPFALENFIQFDPQQKMILIVDDTPITLEMISTWLVKAGFKTSTARNGNRALTSAQQGQPDLILLDIMLPDVDGFEICRRLKADDATKNIPVIFMSVLTEMHDKVKGFQAGAIDYISKPLHYEEFFARVVTHLNLQELTNQLEQKVAQRTQALTLSNQQLQAEISKRQQVAEELQKNQERLDLALSAANDGLYDWNMQANQSYFSPRYYTMLGYDADELLISTESWLNLLHPDDQAAVIDMFQEIIEQGRDTMEAEFRMQAKNGEWRWILSRGKITERDENGQPLRLVGTHTDITERKRTEEELSRRNRELTLLNQVIAASASNFEPETILETVCHELAQAFQLAHVSAALIDPTGTKATIVAEYREETRPQFQGLSFSLNNMPLAHQLLAEKKPTIINDIHADPEIARYSDNLTQLNIASLAVLPLVIEQKAVGSLNLYSAATNQFSTEALALIWSVAEQVSGALARAQLYKSNQQLEEQFRQSQKMEAIGRLAGGMAHDFNNLLTVITGYTELLLYRHIQKGTPQYREIEQIHKAGKRATTLTRQLLAFSRQQVIQPKELDLNDIISDINEMIRRLISENIELVIVLDPMLGRIKADPGQIEQLIVNLVVNAYDAMPQGGTLTITTTNVDLDSGFVRQYVGLNPGPYVKLNISDTGIGMDEETKLHIFEPFFTTKAQGKGTGLGLSIVYGIVQQNEGYVIVHSQPGQGTMFDIYLPRLASRKDVAGEDQTSIEAQPGTETILLVEDEEMVRQLARYALLENGYHVLEAQNGQEAIDVCAHYNGCIDLLLTDVVMPGKLSGRKLAEQLEAKYPHMKVLYMSGYTEDTIVRQGIIEANLAFLQKPFSPASLTRKVREVLAAGN